MGISFVARYRCFLEWEGVVPCKIEITQCIHHFMIYIMVGALSLNIFPARVIGIEYFYTCSYNPLLCGSCMFAN